MNGPRRVVMLLQSYHPQIGGAQRQVASLAPFLRRLGIEVTVITRRPAGLKPFEVVDGVPVYRIAAPAPKALGAVLYTLGTLFLIARLHPDVIHAHGLLSPAMTALAAKKILGIPTVVKILRGGVLGDVATVRRRSMERLWFNSMGRNIDAFVVISDEIDQELDQIGISAKKRHRIPNGVDIDLFRPADSPQDLRAELRLDGAPVAVFAGRFEAEKNLDLLVRAWNAIHDRYPNSLLLMIGEGAELKRLRRMATSSIRFVGPVDNIAPFLQAADVFVLPSRCEGLSNALLEAMSTGVAVIATDVGGARAAVADGESGKVIPAGDLCALEAAIVRLFADSEVRRTFGANARSRMVRDYALSNTADKLRGLYEELVKRRKS